MTNMPNILCIGSVLWDVVGVSDKAMAMGHDVAGHIREIPGGVALNIAMELAKQGLQPGLLSSVGQDFAGDRLVAEAESIGLVTEYLWRDPNLPTDRYMVIEAAGTVVAAIADARSLEKAGDAILTPMIDGRLGSVETPWTGLVALDGNLTTELLAQIAEAPAFSKADLRVAPASPGKVKRLRPLRSHPKATTYLNRTEAEIILDRPFKTSQDAAHALVTDGYARVLVTDGAQSCSEAGADHIFTRVPPQVKAQRITGAGDTFMAAHIAAELRGVSAETALETALETAARYVSHIPEHSP